jgi:uncharacterized membrane protein YdjX (TVP38/TMEM64 family)
LSAGDAPQLPKARKRDWRLGAGLAFIGLAVVSFVVSSFFVDWNAVLAWLQHRRAQLRSWAEVFPVLASGAYFLAYVLFTGLSLPGALILSLAGGAIFGLWWGTLLISFASTTGASFAFLVSRYLLRERVQAKYGARLHTINAELDHEGAYYLFALRLNPVIPYFLINLLFGLTNLPLRRFWWVSQVGMLPATVIYTNAGARLAEIESVKDIVSLPVLASLIALSLFPLLARKVANWLRRAKQPPHTPAS